MPSYLPPPRIFVIPASEADVALVFRRGPSGWYHLLKWDLARDALEPGAWLRGRIYPEKCDVSPDGLLLVYLIHQGRKGRTSYSDAWTGVSRLPWLTALGLWPWGTTYGGGGRFLAPRRVLIRGGCDGEPHPDHPAHGLTIEFGNSPLHRSTDEVEGADWSGRDRHGALLFARAGKLYRGTKTGEELLVADLQGLMPAPEPSPAWASAPLTRKRRIGGGS